MMNPVIYIEESAVSSIKDNTRIIIAHLIKLYYQYDDYKARKNAWMGSILNNWKNLNDDVKLSDYFKLTQYDIDTIYDKAIKLASSETGIPERNININIFKNYFGDIVNYSDIEYIQGFIDEYVVNPEEDSSLDVKIFKADKPKKYIIKKKKY